jgi:hypothetical protein
MWFVVDRRASGFAGITFAVTGYVNLVALCVVFRTSLLDCCDDRF